MDTRNVLVAILLQVVLDAKAAKGGERQFNGLVDVYLKTLQSDGIAGLYRGFNISCVSVSWSLLWNVRLFEASTPHRSLQDSFFASFPLGWLITNGSPSFFIIWEKASGEFLF